MKLLCEQKMKSRADADDIAAAIEYLWLITAYFNIIRTPYIVKVLNPTDEKNALFLAENIWNPQEIEFDTVVKYVEK